MRSYFFSILLFVIMSLSGSEKVVSFDQAMKPNEFFRSTNLYGYSHWLCMKHLYDTFVKSEKYFSAKPRIPKIIHHIWLGSPLPDTCKTFRESWIKKHPDWQFLLWTDKEIEAFGLQNKTLYDATTNYGSKSDIARYEILYRHGGLYIDTDFECLQNFDELHHKLNFYTGIGLEKEVALYNGLIASIPGHPILKKCIDTLPKAPVQNPTSEQIMQSTGPHHFARSFFAIIDLLPKDHPIAALPTSFFYAWPHYHRNDQKPQRWVQPESLALHYWHVSWMQ